MEGRDSMQLIYRWTKSLDPSLKRGFWAPEEDAVSLTPRKSVPRKFDWLSYVQLYALLS